MQENMQEALEEQRAAREALSSYGFGLAIPKAILRRDRADEAVFRLQNHPVQKKSLLGIAASLDYVTQYRQIVDLQAIGAALDTLMTNLERMPSRMRDDGSFAAELRAALEARG